MSLSTSLHLGFDPFPSSQKKHARCHWKMTLFTEAQTQLIVKPFTNQLAGYQRAKRCEIGISLKWIASRIQAVSVPKKTIMPDILYAACSSWLRKIQWLIQCLYTPSVDKRHYSINSDGWMNHLWSVTVEWMRSAWLYDCGKNEKKNNHPPQTSCCAQVRKQNTCCWTSVTRGSIPWTFK